MEICDKWLNNKTRNPITGRKIKINGPLYRQFEKDCSNFAQIKNKNLTSKQQLGLKWAMESPEYIHRCLNLLLVFKRLRRAHLIEKPLHHFYRFEWELIDKYKLCIHERQEGTVLVHNCDDHLCRDFELTDDVVGKCLEFACGPRGLDTRIKRWSFTLWANHDITGKSAGLIAFLCAQDEITEKELEKKGNDYIKKFDKTLREYGFSLTYKVRKMRPIK